MKDWINKLLLICLFFSGSFVANANHLFGADIRYVHVSGNVYSIIMDFYGDCSSSVSSSLQTSTPKVDVYKYNTLIKTKTLSLVGSGGTEVTPVCPSQINNTTCNGGTIPGVKKFTYSALDTLTDTCSNWRFRFNGTMGGGVSAGRSSTISNINAPGSSVMNLEAMLNNIGGYNSAVTYTTIPTPFFCINKPAQYNPGAVDPNNDSLNFSLVDGLVIGGTVVYLAPYTASSPLAVLAGTFSVDNITGQVNFTPNLAQKSLVVSRVNEYRNGVLVGYSMREMTFVVLSTCNNNPPTGNVGNANGGTVMSATSFKVCQGQGAFSFNIYPTDPDGNTISMTVTGIPSGAIASVSNNNTIAPTFFFNWNTSVAAIGNYTFFVTYQDDGCPLSTKQTIAYTINIAPKTPFIYSQTQAATCTKKGKYQISATGTAPFSKIVMQGSTLIQTTNGLSAIHTDSLAPGTYSIKISDATSCFSDTIINISSPSTVHATYSLTPLTCYGISTGIISSVPSNGITPYQYALGSGSYSNNPTFTGLAAGTYVYKIKDASDCTKDTTLTILSPSVIVPAVSSISLPLCVGSSNGSITMNASGGTPNYRYAINGGTFSSVNTLTGLSANNYLITVKDSNNCVHDTTITVPSPAILVPVVTSISLPLCVGSSNGSITMNASGGSPNYRYAINGGAFSSVNVFTGLAVSSYLVTVKDSNNCTHDTTVFVPSPTLVIPQVVSITIPLCFGANNGEISMSANGGTSPYRFAMNGGVFSSTTSFFGLFAGSYIITVKDTNNCTHDTTINVLQPSSIQIAITEFETKCFGDANGFVIVNGIGGTPTYNYAVNGGIFQINDSIKNLSVGSYTITVKDANGCIKDTTAVISQPQILKITSFQITQPTCEGFSDGSISVSSNGGTLPLQYQLNNEGFALNNLFQNLGAGIYVVTIQDANGCLKDTNVILIGYPHIYVDSVNTKPATCFGVDDGELTVYASGGNPPLQFAINNGFPSLSNFFSNLASTNYAVQVTDDKGCVKDTSVYVPSPKVMDMNMVIRNNDCIGTDNEGAIRVEVAGGTSPYVYLWSTSSTADSIFSLNNGKYFVVVTDAKGCEDTAFAEVNYDDCCTVFVPSAFTPNNDGRNDGVGVLFKGDMELKEFSIYNRYGQRVFCGKNVNERWDGTFNGEQQVIGSYYYYIRALCGYKQNVEQRFKGDILLLR